MIQPPIHPRVRLAENCGKFFVLCFQPVTFPCASCAQVTLASASETMATAHSRSARDRHWTSWALGPHDTVQTHSPHSGNRRARPRPGKLARACTSLQAWIPGAKKRTPHQNRSAPSCASTWLTQERSSMKPRSDCEVFCIPLRSDSYESSSMVKGPS